MNPPDQPTGIIGQTCGQPLHDLVHRTPTLAPTPRTERYRCTCNPNMDEADAAWILCRTLERELAAIERLRFGADADRRRLRCELAAAKAECERFRLFTLKQDGELTRLRALFPAILAALRNGGGCTTDVSVEFLECVPNEVASVVSRLRAEVERWTTKIGNQADRIRYLEGATNHATGTPLSQAIARAEKAEAELADWSVLKGWGGTPEIVHKFIKGQQTRIHYCQNLEAELITERARLDYLGLHMGMPQVSEALNLPFSQCFPIRDAIDLAMKNETTTP